MKLLLLCLTLGCAGCSTVTYQSPNGEKLTRTTFMVQTKAGRVAMMMPNGAWVELENYGSDGISGAAAVTEAAVRAAISSAK